MKFKCMFPIVSLMLLGAGAGFAKEAAMPSAAELKEMRAGMLERSGFVRESYDAEDMTLLLGNAEMGGRARLDGLGFDRLWFADFWRTAAARMPIFGPRFVMDGDVAKAAKYGQRLGLADGVLETVVSLPGGSYRSEIYFSAADKDVLVVRLSDLKGSAKKLKLQLPVSDVSGEEGGRWDVRESAKEDVFKVKQESGQVVMGRTDAEMMKSWKRMFWAPVNSQGKDVPRVTNEMVWGAWCSSALKATGNAGEYGVEVGDADEVLLLFSETTSWDGGFMEARVRQSLRGERDAAALLAAHRAAWDAMWEGTAVLDLPDKRHEKLWYRSVFWMFATSGSQRFLPGECQFGHEGWNMIPFTIGGGGWGVHGFTAIGKPGLARTMLSEHFKPEGMYQNARHWLKYAQGERERMKLTGDLGKYPAKVDAAEARAFGHEVQITGDGTLTTYGNQMHLQGFGLNMFERFARYYPGVPEAEMERWLYPVAKGTAEFWANFLIWDAKAGEYITPLTWSGSEGGKQVNPMDAIFGAKKCLRLAADYAERQGIDAELVKKWRYMDERMKFLSNDEVYLQNREHDGSIPKVSVGYNGIRYMNAANFVYSEMVDELDRAKVERTLGRISDANQFGKGFAVFHSAWTATAECLFGRGDSALGYMDGVLRAYDQSGTAIRECEDRHMPYFLTNTDAYLLVPIYMLMQSSPEGVKAFPAVPKDWKDVAFYNLPADGGVKVSGKMLGSEVKWVRYVDAEGKVRVE